MKPTMFDKERPFHRAAKMQDLPVLWNIFSKIEQIMSQKFKYI